MPGDTQAGQLQSWETTRLWQALARIDTAAADEVRTALKTCLPDIEKILNKGGTPPTDFTLHDADHSYRVAERMVEIIPADVVSALTCYELALLLLAAYLHDIGMTPEQGKVKLYYDYILTGDRQTLKDGQLREFQQWLDDEREGITAPLAKGQPTPADNSLAGELTAYYCRFRHDDWSEEWIRGPLAQKGFRLRTYTGWVDDLVRLCRSHHEGYADLLAQSFHPRLVGTPSAIVHLRYLAVVLRVADILEFDPERTPDVVLRHRDIAPRSLDYWWKDHCRSFTLNDNRLVISARPPSARIHRAIEVTVQAVDEELRLVRRLADEIPFDRAPFPYEKLPHRWDLESSVHSDLAPQGNSYEYIDGSFRPNTSKLLKLLSGLELYGNPLSALRELLQNAFDAVREQIAYKPWAAGSNGFRDL